MPHITQHEAAELWELCRDHAIAATKLRMMAQQCQDTEARGTLQRHAQQFQQAAQRLYQMLQEPGQAGYGATWQTGTGATWQAATGQAVGQAAGATQWMQAPQASGLAGIDAVIVGDCLRMCKTFAVQCMWGATEAAQPARSYLNQLAGEHLRMAEEHYHWLERRGLYASPRANYEAIHEYTGKLQQILNAGQSPAYAAQPAYAASAVAGSPAYGMPQGAYGQTGYAGQARYPEPGYGETGYGGQGSYAQTGYAAQAGYGGYAGSDVGQEYRQDYRQDYQRFENRAGDYGRESGSAGGYRDESRTS